MRKLLIVIVTVALSGACSNPEKEQLKKTTIPTYDKTTGKLTELTYDMNKNGKIDTWTQMDGATPLSARQDMDEDGQIDRWEHYDANAKLVKVGFSTFNDGKPNTWAYPNAQGLIERVETSSRGDEKKIERREFLEGNVVVRVEEDTNGDGKVDKWETHENGTVKTAAFDENGDGQPDRRLTYGGGDVVTVETRSDGSWQLKK